MVLAPINLSSNGLRPVVDNVNILTHQLLFWIQRNPRILKLLWRTRRPVIWYAEILRMKLSSQARCALALAGLALVWPATVHADPLTVKTEQGKVHGKTINDGKVKAFLGLALCGSAGGRSALEGASAGGQVEGRARRDQVRRALRPGPRLRRHDLSGDGEQRGLPLPERLRARRCRKTKASCR